MHRKITGEGRGIQSNSKNFQQTKVNACCLVFFSSCFINLWFLAKGTFDYRCLATNVWEPLISHPKVLPFPREFPCSFPFLSAPAITTITVAVCVKRQIGRGNKTSTERKITKSSHTMKSRNFSPASSPDSLLLLLQFNLTGVKSCSTSLQTFSV